MSLADTIAGVIRLASVRALRADERAEAIRSVAALEARLDGAEAARIEDVGAAKGLLNEALARSEMVWRQDRDRINALTARLRELAIEGHQGGWGNHITHDFATCPEPSCVADRALIGEQP